MVSPPQIPRNTERAQCAGRVALVVEEEQRGQQHTHYKGWDTPKDNPGPGRLCSCRAYRGGDRAKAALQEDGGRARPIVRQHGYETSGERDPSPASVTTEEIL